MTAPAPSAPVADHVNEVRLVGRVSAEPTATVLPSGDEVVTVRVVVERPRPPAGQGKKGKVDTVMCSAWSASVRRRVRLWIAGDVVEVTGALRRRFWRSDAGARSRYDVELVSARRLARAEADPESTPAGSADDVMRAAGA